MDDDGLVTDWNRGDELIFGWTRSEVLGRRLSDTIIHAGFTGPASRSSPRRPAP
jgi:PAS domain S-box-containing protein